MYTNKSIRNHIGWAWYNRQFFANLGTLENIHKFQIILRLSSCHYYCIVWLNGFKLGSHESGHLPFEFDITDLVSNIDTTLNLVVAVNNTLTPFTIPPGQVFHGTNSSL